VDKIAQDLRIVCSGHDESLLGPVVQYQLVGDLAVLQRSLTVPIGVDVGDLADLYRSSSSLHWIKAKDPVPARHGVANACVTHEKQRPATFPEHALFSVRGEAPAGSQVACSVAAALLFSCAQLAHQNFRKRSLSLVDRDHRCTPSVIIADRTARNVVVVADHRRAAHVPSHLVFPGHSAHLGQS
jgi:hypothetical protein